MAACYSIHCKNGPKFYLASLLMPIFLIPLFFSLLIWQACLHQCEYEHLGDQSCANTEASWRRWYWMKCFKIRVKWAQWKGWGHHGVRGVRMAEMPSPSTQESWEGCACWCLKTVEEKEAWAAAGQGEQVAFGKADSSKVSPSMWGFTAWSENSLLSTKSLDVLMQMSGGQKVRQAGSRQRRRRVRD